MSKNVDLFRSLPDVLSISDAAKALGVGRCSVYRLVNENRLKHIKIGRIIRIPRPYFEEFVFGQQ